MHKVIVMLIITLLTTSFSYCEDTFSWLNDLKNKTRELPVIITNPTGGYTAIWEEIGDKPPEELLGTPPRHYFYRIVDAAGKAVVSKREFEFWRTSHYPSYFAVLFNSKSLLWLDADRLLILAWKWFDPSARPERAVIDSNGELVDGPDSAMEGGVGNYAVLLKDSEGRAHAFDRWAGLRAMTVYPEFSKVRKMSRQEWKEFHNKYPADVFIIHERPTCMITSDDKLLICNRLDWGKTPRSERGLWHKYRPDKLFYVLADLEGNLISEPVVFDLVEYAFRKIPGMHLGGYYYVSHENQTMDESEAVDKDMDLSRLPDGSIILSVTGEDETGKLCVCQVRFTPEGEIEKPQQLEVVNPRPFTEDRILPVAKVAWARGMETRLVLFGFDEAGNFYAYRQKWDKARD